VRNLCTDKEDEAVVRSIAYLAESFGLDVTAEGVEREDQRKRLRELGCESAQGYLFGRPMPGERVMKIMRGATHSGLARWPRRHAEAHATPSTEQGAETPRPRSPSVPRRAGSGP